MDLETVEIKLAQQSFLTLQEVENNLDSEMSGFYWIYTNKTIQDFKETSDPNNIKHINLKNISTLHENLEYVIHQQDRELWCIYNGRGKSLKKRIKQEFHQGRGTGTLALLRDFEVENFKIKYIICNNDDIDRGVIDNYKLLEKDLERIWRLNNKFPIFCRI